MNTNPFQVRRALCLIILLACFSADIHAQGFYHNYPFSTWFQGGPQTIYPQTNGGYRLAASSFPDFGNEISLLWYNTDAQGALIDVETEAIPLGVFPIHLLENGVLWTELAGNTIIVRLADGNTLDLNFPGVISVEALNIEPGLDGAVFVRGYTTTGVNSYTGFVSKISPDGNLLWQSTHPYPTLNNNSANNLVPTADGGCIVESSKAGFNYDDIHYLHKFSNTGALQWTYSSLNAAPSQIYTLRNFAINQAQESFLPVRTANQTGLTDSLFLLRISPGGTLLKKTNISQALNAPGYRPEARVVIPTADGGCVLLLEGHILVSTEKRLVKVGANGAVQWQKTLNFLDSDGVVGLSDGREEPDGSLLLLGYANVQEDLFFIKFGADGAVFPHVLDGRVARDSTFNCTVDDFDPPFEGWVVRATGNNLNYYAATDANGHYTISDLDNGTYLVEVVPPNYLWSVCNGPLSVSFNSTDPLTDTLDLPVQALYDCPIMSADMQTGLLRRCMQATYTVQYCNSGNQTADVAQLSILLDPLLLLNSVSAPYTLSGDTILIDLGSVPPGFCDEISLNVTVDCDAELGQTLCSEVHVSPDSICGDDDVPGWSGAYIVTSAECEGDSVKLILQNQGDAPSQQLDFIIVDDHVITIQGTFSLPAGGSEFYTVPADGSTWRLIAQQEPGFPFANPTASVAVEGCTVVPGLYSIGMVNLFSNFSGDPYQDVACNVVIGSFDPNDKQAFPTGFGDEHLIEQNEPLEYLIRFQNTGTDTAFTVVIRDTLSAWLDPGSIRPGAASHPYTWSLTGPGIVRFVFDDILLPDSNVNEAASHGFVQFRINQKTDVPLGSVIENRAGIYFDFNEPVITNTVFHTVGHNFLPLSASPRPNTLPRIRLEPNPASQTTLLSSDLPLPPGLTLVVRDATGRLVGVQTLQGQTTEIPRNGLPSGLYFVELRNRNGLVAVSKLIWTE